MSAGSTCQDTDYAKHIQEILDELGPPGAMSRFFTVSTKAFSLPKSTRCHSKPKNNALRRTPLAITRMVRAHVPHCAHGSNIFLSF